MCTREGKDKKPTGKQWKEKTQRAHERCIKQISMIDMASISYGRRHDEPRDEQTNKKARRQIGKQANKKKNRQVRKQTKGGIHEGQM